MDKADLKRLIFPALAALILHGFLISLKLPKQETLNPAFSGNPIKIAINTISPPAIVPQKKEELKRTEKIGAALETVKNWLFTPATEDGRPVAMWVDVPIEFQLM